jgi:hypothetical protein
MNLDFAYTLTDIEVIEEEEEPADHPPEVPFEVNNHRPIDGDRCMQEMRVLCGGQRKEAR